MSFLPSKRFSFYLCMVLCCQSFGPSTQGAWLWDGAKGMVSTGYNYFLGNENNTGNEDGTSSDSNDSSDGNQSQNNDTDNNNTNNQNNGTGNTINIQGSSSGNQKNTNENQPPFNDPFTNFMTQALYPNGVPGSNNTNNNNANANPNNTIVNDEPGHKEAEAQRRQKQAYYYAYCLDEEEVGDKDKALTLDQEKKGTVTSAYVLGVVMVSYVVSKFLPSLGPPKQGQRARS